MADLRLGRTAWPVIALAWLLALGTSGPARADRILIRGGSQIRGVILPDKDTRQPRQVLVQAETLTTPIRYRKDQIVEVISEPSPLKDYLARRDEVEPTAQAQYDLGLWCEQKKLLPYADLHYRRAVEIDKGFAPAHKKLGHVQYEDGWLTVDELRRAQGLVKYRGKWISLEEKAKLDDEAVERASRAAWSRRLKVLRDAVAFGSPDRKREAEAQLTAIDDPAAVVPLMQIFGREEDVALRALLAQLLGGIPGNEAASGLVARLLAETDADVRQATMDELARRDEANVVPELVKALRSKDLAVVNRAAWALGNLNAVAAVPKLLAVLIVTEDRMVWVPSDSGPGGTGIGVGFSSPAGGGMAAPAMPPPAVPAPVVATAPVVGAVGYNPYYGMSSVAVGPGVVAFGGGSPYPMYASGASLSVGDGIPGRGPQPRFVRNTYRNIEVLAALQKLTGQRFGYDVATWRQWVNTSFRAEATPARRVPQP